MVYDLGLIKKIYAEMPHKVNAARQLIGKPLTLTEKYYTLTYSELIRRSLLSVEKIMWTLHRTG